MRITSLTLRSFRSYETLTIDFGESGRPEIFIGENGTGKTNIVEAVSLLSLGRSCLRADQETMLRFGHDFFRVRADIQTDDGAAKSVECVFQTSPRRASAYFVQDARTPLLNFIGVLPSITFLPQDLDLFTGSPSGRRNVIDALLSQLQPTYAERRLSYEKVLKQRNALLRRIAEGESPSSDLDVWDAELSLHGTGIRRERAKVLESFSRMLPAELRSLSESPATLTVRSSIGSGDLAADLQHSRAKDILLRTTTVGPHRDDWTILADDHPIGDYYSRGQQRSAFLALLFVSASLFEAHRNERPVILLDDVLSELDDAHQQALLRRLEGHQVLLTTTHPIPQITGLRTWAVRGEGIVETATADVA